MSALWRPSSSAGQSIKNSVVFGDIVQISGVRGSVTISNERPMYRVLPATVTPVRLSREQARAQPSRVLLARHRVVPFSGRARTWNDLTEWRGNAQPITARLLHATGGQGKTRLAAEFATQCASAGWTVWEVAPTAASVYGTGQPIDLQGTGLLAIVDYADRWPMSALLALFSHLHRLQATTGMKVRILLLARSSGYWWPALASRADTDMNIEVSETKLPALAADSDDDRNSLFVTAADHFASVLGIDGTGNWSPPTLQGDDFRHVLAVHMAALATVAASWHGDTPPASPAAISAYLLRREQAHWQQLYSRTENSIATPPVVMQRATYTATLTGALPRTAARRALVQVQLAGDVQSADRIIDEHRGCYPPADERTVLEALHPDRLGEDLVALSTPGHGNNEVASLVDDWVLAAPAALVVMEQDPLRRASTAIIVLIETAHRWPHIATEVLYPLVREYPDLVIAAGGAAVARLTTIPGLDPTILERLEELLPDGRHTDLDIAAAAISNCLTRYRLSRVADVAERAGLHATHARRLFFAGRHGEALPAAQEAVALYRRLTAADPAALHPGLGASLSIHCAVLAELGRHDEALSSANEAVAIYRPLATANPSEYLPNLALMLTSQGGRLAALGRRAEALVSTAEAVTQYRTLAVADPAAYLPDLAGSLNNLSNHLSDLGHLNECIEAADEAVSIQRRLASANSAVYLPDLALSLHNLGKHLSGLGRREEAVASTREAVLIRRQLADINPAAHLSDLAGSLNNLSNHLSELGESEAGLLAAEEAVAIRRQLAEVNPLAYLPNLALVLNNFGNHLAKCGKHVEGLAAAQEAVAHYRKLVASHPAMYLSILAGCLVNLSNHLSAIGRNDEAVAAADEAVNHYRVASVKSAAQVPGLAAALNSFGTHLCEIGRHDEALAAIREALAIRQQLAAVNTVAYSPDLASSLCAYAKVCLRAEVNLPQALEKTMEAIDIYTELSEQLPQAFLDYLYGTYLMLADVLQRIGRDGDADRIRRQLGEVISGL
ncbi:tetratricopeptide repeat protein [Actinoplanes sp. TBRC 11911]|uniref:tetratricopeptide repeat protein n=1 Tax=Actinoplanes sp. TBRC 11911 TaxID=2729386 RepID=UPI00145F8F80|nr:tetratricopeptide repeat protein [Actinoplanes sp. TBRC 11911]NMO57528.1 tetratricopeptide repeat protein [Actinoplanes sp. TBRC 11911]